MATLGEKLFNPGNIRPDGVKWQGEIQPSAHSGYKQFKDMAHGYRAIFINLNTNVYVRGRKTIEKIIEKYAPKEDGNNPERYITNVSKWTGIARNKEVTANDFVPLVRAISRQEIGKIFESDLQKGYQLYLESPQARLAGKKKIISYTLIGLAGFCFVLAGVAFLLNSKK